MAITIVSSQVDEDASGAAITFSLAGAQENDVVIVSVAYGGNTEIGLVTGGYTTIAGGTSSCALHTYLKQMGVSPDANVQVNTSVLGQGKVATCWIFRGVDEADPLDAVPGQSIDSTANPDPQAVNVVTPDAMVLALAASENSDSTVTAPAGYSTAVGTASFGFSGGTDVSHWGATRVVGTGTEDPGTFTSWSAGDHRTITIALRAASIVVPVSPTFGMSTVNIRGTTRMVGFSRSSPIIVGDKRVSHTNEKPSRLRDTHWTGWHEGMRHIHLLPLPESRPCQANVGPSRSRWSVQSLYEDDLSAVRWQRLHTVGKNNGAHGSTIPRA